MKSWIRHILVFLISISLYSFATFSYAADDTPEKNTIKEKVQSAIKIKRNATENKENQIVEAPSSTDTSTGQNDILGTTPLPDDSATETQTGEVDTELTIEEKEKVKQELNAYIIDSYKAQGNKIIKELDAKLQKAIPDPDEREEAYKKILISLQLREKRINNMKAGETKKLILKEFLNHMINNIEKKIENIEK
jgi:hypothetical protein